MIKGKVAGMDAFGRFPNFSTVMHWTHLICMMKTMMAKRLKDL